MSIRIYNTLSRQVEDFKPIVEKQVKFYGCGPTVYNFAHLGNLRTYVFEDILRRTLESSGYAVNHVMNVTDVGHLESDADEGDDKMSLASKREQKSPWDIARHYEDVFFEDLKALHVLHPTTVCRATEHIEHMIKFIQVLEQKGFTYTVDGNVYFRKKKFPDYLKLSRLPEDESLDQSRVERDPRKEDQRDFVLWFSQSKFPNQIMQWDSPWGRGFPGWHIECSVMASEYLGEHFDIHAGGIDHVNVHHTNEIAQSEGCFGHQWVNYWVHGEFLVLDKEKMSKSKGNFLRLQTIVDKGYDPLHYRYLCFGAHYRSRLFFSWDALDGAKNAFESLRNRVIAWKLNPKKGRDQVAPQTLSSSFWEAMRDDLDTPKALSVIWEVAKSSQLSTTQKFELLKDFDRVLGWGIESFSRPELDTAHMDLIQAREKVRKAKDWAKSDAIRDELLAAGIQLKDTPKGPDWYLVE